jgi:hypothetical protein
MNFELNVKEITFDTYILIGKINNQNILEKLKKFILENKNNELNYKTNVKGCFTGFHSLVDNNYFHDFLKLIDSYIKIIYKHNFIIQEAWGNVCKKEDEIYPHSHSGNTAFCGILYLTNGGPGTFFHEHNIIIKEEIGKFVLFHPDLTHSVKKIENDIERITVAFNMNEVKLWENIENAKRINKNDI